MAKETTTPEKTAKVDAQPAAQETMAPPVAPKKKSKTGLFVVIGAVVVLLLAFAGGTAFAAFSNKSVPVFSDVVEAGEKVAFSVTDSAPEATKDLIAPLRALAGEDLSEEDLKEYFNEEVEYTSSKFEVEMVLEDDEIKFEAGMSGYMSIDEDSIESTELEIDIDGALTSEGTKMSGNGELVLTEGNLYVKIDEFPAIGYDLSSVKGVWLEANVEEDLKEYAEVLTEEEVNTEDVGFTEDDLEMLEALINSETISENTEKMDDEKIGDVRTHCYSLSLDDKQMMAVLEEVNEAAPKEEQMTEDEMEDAVDGLDNLTLEWCVGRVDGMLYRIGVDMETDEGDLSVDIKMWDFDVTETVKEPSDTEDLEEAVNELMEEIYGSYDDYDYDYDDYDYSEIENMTDEEFEAYMDEVYGE